MVLVGAVAGGRHPAGRLLRRHRPLAAASGPARRRPRPTTAVRRIPGAHGGPRLGRDRRRRAGRAKAGTANVRPPRPAGSASKSAATLPDVPAFAVTPQVVHTATVDLRVGRGQLDSVTRDITVLAGADGGYVDSSSLSGGTARRSPVSGTVVFRVLDADFADAIVQGGEPGCGGGSEDQREGRHHRGGPERGVYRGPPGRGHPAPEQAGPGHRSRHLSADPGAALPGGTAAATAPGGAGRARELGRPGHRDGRPDGAGGARRGRRSAPHRPPPPPSPPGATCATTPWPCSTGWPWPAAGPCPSSSCWPWSAWSPCGWSGGGGRPSPRPDRRGRRTGQRVVRARTRQPVRATTTTRRADDGEAASTTSTTPAATTATTRAGTWS